MNDTSQVDNMRHNECSGRKRGYNKKNKVDAMAMFGCEEGQGLLSQGRLADEVQAHQLRGFLYQRPSADLVIPR